MSLSHRDHANLLCIVPILADVLSLVLKGNHLIGCYLLTLLLYPKEGKSKNRVGTRTHPPATGRRSPKVRTKDLYWIRHRAMCLFALHCHTSLVIRNEECWGHGLESTDRFDLFGRLRLTLFQSFPVNHTGIYFWFLDQFHKTL